MAKFAKKTRLRLGEPMLRGNPKGAPWTPCVDALSPLDTNLAISADDFVATYGTTVIPPWQDQPTTPFWTSPTIANWAISSASPRSDTYHFRRTHVTGGSNAAIAPAYAFRCAKTPASPSSLHRFATANLSPGNTISVDYWAKRSSAFGTSAILSRFFFFRDVDDGSAFDSDSTNHGNLPTTYTQFQANAVAPAGTEYVQFEIFITAVGVLNGTTFDVDDAIVEVSA